MGSVFGAGQRFRRDGCSGITLAPLWEAVPSFKMPSEVLQVRRASRQTRYAHERGPAGGRDAASLPTR